MEKYIIYEVTVIKLFIIKWHAKIHYNKNVFLVFKPLVRGTSEVHE